MKKIGIKREKEIVCIVELVDAYYTHYTVININLKIVHFLTALEPAKQE